MALPEKDLLIIRQDFDTIVNKIKKGKAHELSEGDTDYLAACRKGQKGEKERKQPFSEYSCTKTCLLFEASLYAYDTFLRERSEKE